MSKLFWERMGKDLDNCELHGFTRLMVSCNIEQQQNDRDLGNAVVHYDELVKQVISRIITYPGTTVFAGSSKIWGRLFEIALACQFSIGTASTEFGFGTTLGNSYEPIHHSLAIKRNLFSEPQTIQTIWLGTPLKARSAFACGLISEVVAFDRLESSADLLAQRDS